MTLAHDAMIELKQTIEERFHVSERDRYMLRGIARLGLITGPVAILVEVTLRLFGRHSFEPLIATIAGYAGLAVFVGAVEGYHDWAKEEKAKEKIQLGTERP